MTFVANSTMTIMHIHRQATQIAWNVLCPYHEMSCIFPATQSNRNEINWTRVSSQGQLIHDM